MARKLRIAVSVFFGVLTVALCMLWVRSYWRADSIHFMANGGYVYSLVADAGLVEVSRGIDVESNGMFAPGDYWVNAWDYHQRRRETKARLLVPFKFRSGQHYFRLEIPFWFPVFLVAATSVLTLRSIRFSVRTLLVATTVVAVVLGLAVWGGR
jgi:hypothetical protein